MALQLNSDRITLNAGGRLYETTTTTLRASGSTYFEALLADKGDTIAGQ